jgi:anti-sigma factor RsiW
VKCPQAETLLHAYNDGELAGVDRSAFEAHMLACDQCFRACRLQARFKAAVRGHLPPRSVPADVESRLRASLATTTPGRAPWRAYPRYVPAAAAAVFVAVVLIGVRGRSSPVLEQVRRTYQAAMPMDFVDSDCRSVAEWFRRHVDFAVKAPPLERRGDCQGGRVINFQDRFAAYFDVLTTDGRRLGVAVLDDDAEIDAPQQMINGLDIALVSKRGVSTMAFRDRDGLVYVVTGDLDADHLTRYLPASFHH